MSIFNRPADCKHVYAVYSGYNFYFLLEIFSLRRSLAILDVEELDVVSQWNNFKFRFPNFPSLSAPIILNYYL